MAKRLRVKFTDPEGVFYEIKISDPNYTSTFVREVQGTAVLDYPKVDTMGILRGSVLKMQLEASVDIQYYSFLYNTVGDAQLGVELFRDNEIFWRGFIKPNGIVESFVNDYWIINVQAIDGLGYLENTQFLDPDGFIYSGPVSEIDLLTRCLQLTGQTMNFRLYDFNIYFTTNDKVFPSIANTPITDTYVNTDRYKQTDQEKSAFTAKEVLESILKKYGAYVVQENGYWNVIRLIDYFSEETSLRYFEYDYLGVYTGNTEIPNRVQVLGSQINGFYPHHANANQQKYYNVALGSYKVYYEHGFIESILKNTNLYFNNTSGDIDFWQITNNQEDNFTYELIDGNYIATWKSYYDTNQLALETTVNQKVSQSDILTIKANVNFGVTPTTDLEHRAIVTLISPNGIYYLNENNPAQWESEEKAIRFFYIERTYVGESREGVQQFQVKTEGCPEDGLINVHFFLPSTSSFFSIPGSYTRINSFSISGEQLGIKGESFTATRGLEVINGRRKITTVVELTENIYVADNNSDIYIGGLEDIATDNTIFWSKKIVNGQINVAQQLPLLEWMVRDRLQISSGNALTFSGGIYGYLPYLGITTIDNVGTETEPPTPHKFMTTKYTYNLALNITSVEFQRVFDQIIDNDMKTTGKVLEGVTVVRPSVVG